MCSRHSIEVVAYCLMPNHVHLVVVPPRSDRMHRTIGAVHGQYAQRINRMRSQKGHFWQGRYFSSPLDSAYFINAVRYVELNPVRAGIVINAEDYEWSSAPAHCEFRKDPLVTARPCSGLLSAVESWSRWLSEGVPDESISTLRRHSGQNLPCGSEEFVADLERAAGRQLRFRPAGRQAEVIGDSHI